MASVGSERGSLRRIVPQFLVLNLDRACAFYTDKLGFEIAFVYKGFYAGVTRDGIMIHLKLSDDVDPGRAFKKQHEHLDGYCDTVNVDALYREFQSRNVTFLKPLGDTPWGTREFALEDADGYILYFGQATSSDS